MRWRRIDGVTAATFFAADINPGPVTMACALAAMIRAQAGARAGAEAQILVAKIEGAIRFRTGRADEFLSIPIDMVSHRHGLHGFLHVQECAPR